MNLPAQRVVRLLLAVVLLALFSNFTSLHAEDYAIQLTTPFKSGQKFRFDSTFTDFRMNSLYSDGKLMKQELETNIWSLTAAVEITAVNEKGQATKLNFLLDNFQNQPPGKTNAMILPKGTVVFMEFKDGKKVFIANGKVLSQQVNEVLGSVLDTGSPSDPTDDEIWGVTARKKIGDQWTPKVELAIKPLSASGYKIDADRVKSQVKLMEVKPYRGVNCLRIEGQLSVSDIGVEIPRGMVPKSTYLELNVSGLFPANGQSGRLQSTETLVLDLSAAGKTKDEHIIQLNARAERKVVRNYNY